MNAPAEAVHTSELPLDQIRESGTHIQQMRRARYDQALLRELADSITEVGVLQAIVVRPTTLSDAEPYELVAGERRWLAAKIAGLTQIPATVRALTDDQVLKAQLVENLQREGLHPLEEAEGYDELMKLDKISADQVATMIGKSRSYVFGRLKLLGLDIEGRKAFYNGDIDASRALYVARIATPKLKERALKLAMQKGWNGNEFAFSVRKLREELTSGQFSVDLRKAPFALADASFFEEVKVKKGVTDKRALPDCINCPNRTGNCLDLFNQDDSPDVCMEPACYAIKLRQHSERLRALAVADGATIITGEDAKKIVPRKGKLNGFVDLDEVCEDDEYPGEQPKYPRKGDLAAIEAYDKAMEEWDRKSEAYKSRTFRQLLEGQALPTVLVEDPKTKQLRTMVPLDEAKAAVKKQDIKLSAWRYKAEPSQRHAYSAPNAESATDKQKRLEEEERQRAREEEEMRFRREVLAQIFAKWSGPLKRDEMETLADEFFDNNYQADDTLKFLYGGRKPQPGQMKEADLSRLLAICTVWECIQYSNESPKAMLDLARRLKIDPDKIRKALKDEAKASADAVPKKKKKAKVAA